MRSADGVRAVNVRYAVNLHVSNLPSRGTFTVRKPTLAHHCATLGRGQTYSQFVFVLENTRQLEQNGN